MRPFRPAPLLAALALPLLLHAVPARAANGGAAVSIYPSGIRVPLATFAEPDSGALVIMEDTRNNGFALYAQRVDRHGHPMFAPGGVLIRQISNSTFFENMISDGAGGCLMSWNEVRGTSGNDVIMQRVLANGTLGYGANGIDICNAVNDQGEAFLAPGPSGFYYVVWKDNRVNPTGDADLYAQKLSIAGVPAWTANGIPINTATYVNDGGFGNGGEPGVVADTQGGLVVTWVPDGTRTPRVQRVNSAGVLQWGATGVQYGGNSDDRIGITADGSGGAWMSYSHYSPFPTAYPYVQHVVAAGTLAFTAIGLPLQMTGLGTNFQTYPVHDASGGCMVYGVGNWATYGGYAVRQQVNAAGTLLRGYGEDIGDFIGTFIVTDLGNGVAVTEQQNFAGTGHSVLQLQRYGYDGTAVYPGAGVLVGRGEPEVFAFPSVPSTLANGVLMIGFADGRYSTPTQLIAQVFGQAYDNAGNPLWDDSELPTISTVRDAPGDQGGFVRADWNASAADQPGAAAVTGYRVWRSVPGSLAAALEHVHSRAVAGPFTFGTRRMTAYANTYWEVVGEEPAARLPSYALTVPTGQDSTSGAAADESFMVEAFDDSTHIWWSSSLSGHSVDNLAPPALPSIAAYFGSGSTTLYWGGSSVSDLCCYDVFRGATPGFVASDATRIATTSQVTFTDTHTPAYYRVGARDVHGNLGPTSLVMPNGTAGVGDDPTPHAWRLRADWRRQDGAIALALDVPQADAGSLELFDVAGRKLWSAPFRANGARTLTLTVSAHDAALPTGMVFARAWSASGHALVARALVLR